MDPRFRKLPYPLSLTYIPIRTNKTLKHEAPVASYDACSRCRHRWERSGRCYCFRGVTVLFGLVGFYYGRLRGGGVSCHIVWKLQGQSEKREWDLHGSWTRVWTAILIEARSTNTVAECCKSPSDNRNSWSEMWIVWWCGMGKVILVNHHSILSISFAECSLFFKY